MTTIIERPQGFSTLNQQQGAQNGHDSRSKFGRSRFLVALAAIGLVSLLGLGLNLFNIAQVSITTLLLFGLLVLLIKRQPFSGLLVWIFLVAFLESWVKISFGAGTPDISFSRFIIIVLLITLVAAALRGRFQFLPFSVTDILVIGIPVALILSAPLSTDPKGVAVKTFAIYLVPLTGFFFAKHLVRSERDLHQVLFVITLFGFIAGAYAIYEALTGNVLFLQQGQTITRFYRGDTNLRLIQGLLRNTGNMARVLAITTLVTVYMYMHGKRALTKSIFLAAIVIQMGGLLLTFSRTPIIAVALSLLLVMLFYPQFRKIFLVAALISIVIVAIGWEQFGFTDLAEDRIGELAKDINSRTQRWQAGYKMWLEEPIFGWGYGRYEEESQGFRTDNKRKNISAIESDYLHILVGSGLLGLIPYLAFLLILFAKSLRLYAQTRAPDRQGFITPPVIVIFWAVLLCFLLVSLTARLNHAVVRLLPFVIFGAVVGSHEHLLGHFRYKGNRQIPSDPISNNLQH